MLRESCLNYLAHDEVSDKVSYKLTPPFLPKGGVFKNPLLVLKGSMGVFQVSNSSRLGYALICQSVNHKVRFSFHIFRTPYIIR